MSDQDTESGFLFAYNPMCLPTKVGMYPASVKPLVSLVGRGYMPTFVVPGDCTMAEKSGVYSITNRKNGKRYIGSTVHLTARWKAHRLSLKWGRHHSPHLQRAWERDGKESFTFEVIENCEPSRLAVREQYWIDRFCAADDRFGYNMAPRAYSTLGVKASDEARQRMSTQRTGSRNANALLGEDQVVEIKSLLSRNLSITSIAKQFGVSYFVVWDIAVGKRWQHVTVQGFTPKRQGPGGAAKRGNVSNTRGSNSSLAKLTEGDVRTIRRRANEGRGIQTRLAEEYGVSKTTICNIINRKEWTWLD